MDYNDENMEKLARIVVNSWDHKSLEEFAITKLIECYDDFKECFEQDAENFQEELKGG